MRILVAHNAYHYRGGEDTVVDAEVALLRRHGHEVRLYRRDNAELEHMPRLQAGLSAIWSRRTVDDLAQLQQDFAPQLIHAHNTFPLISPSLYVAARRFGIPVVQTLHNFRLLCPQAMLLREGRGCTDCVGRFPWRGVLHRCYRRSHAQTAVTAAMLGVHRLAGTWRRDVQRYIVLNRMCRDLFVEGGLPLEKMAIKPNFVECPATPAPSRRSGGMFIGRLSPEKGIATLAAALQRLPGLQIDVYGNGPLQEMVERTAGLRYCGFQPAEVLRERMHHAAYLVVPSTGIESFGLVAIEAFACGTPVIASGHGGLGEIVVHRRNGLLFSPGDPDELAGALRHAEREPADMRRMGAEAYQSYLAHYTPERNYEMLMRIYDEAIAALPATVPDAYAKDRAGR